MNVQKAIHSSLDASKAIESTMRGVMFFLKERVTEERSTMETESRSGWALGLSLVEVMLLLVFAAMIVYVTDNARAGGKSRSRR